MVEFNYKSGGYKNPVLLENPYWNVPPLYEVQIRISSLYLSATFDILHNAFSFFNSLINKIKLFWKINCILKKALVFT